MSGGSATPHARTWSTAGILASWCGWSLAVALWAYVVYHVGGELVQVLALAVPVALTAGLFIGGSPSPWADRRRAPLQGADASSATPAPPPEQPKTIVSTSDPVGVSSYPSEPIPAAEASS